MKNINVVFIKDTTITYQFEGSHDISFQQEKKERRPVLEFV